MGGDQAKLVAVRLEVADGHPVRLQPLIDPLPEIDGFLTRLTMNFERPSSRFEQVHFSPPNVVASIGALARCRVCFNSAHELRGPIRSSLVRCRALHDSGCHSGATPV